MVDFKGTVEEVKALVARNLDPDLPIMRGIGVREIGAFLFGGFFCGAESAGPQATRAVRKAAIS